MERLHIAAALGFVLAVSLACKSSAKDDKSESPVTTASPSAVATDTASASATPADSTTPTATAKTPPTVKLEDCGERFAAPARLDGKCADYCGDGYTCDPGQTCVQTSWPTKSGVRNAAVCAPKGVAVRAPVAGAGWDPKAPPPSSSAGSPASAAPSASAKPAAAGVLPMPAATVDAIEHPEGTKCPPGWFAIPARCARPCKTTKDCHGSSKCEPLPPEMGGDTYCASGKWE